MNYWKPDSTAPEGSAALTGALSEYVQSPTLSLNTPDYSSEGSTSELTPQLLNDSVEEVACKSPTKNIEEVVVLDDSEEVEVIEVPQNVEAGPQERVPDLGPQLISDPDESNSFKKREIKCRNIRKCDNSRQRTPSPLQRPKSVEKSKKYPANWTEYKEMGLSVNKDSALKSKLLKCDKETKFEFEKYFNFKTPSLPTEGFKSQSRGGVKIWIQFPYLRCTATKPPIIYSSKEKGHLSRQQLFALIPKERQQIIEKLMKPSRISDLDCKALSVRKWFYKNWKKTDRVEAKLLESSVGLSFLQTYSDEEGALKNASEKVLSQTPPFAEVAEEKEEGEVSDDDSHNLSASLIEEIKEIQKTKEELQKTKEELEELEESLKISQDLGKVNSEPEVVKEEEEVQPEEVKKKRKKSKTDKVSKSVKTKKKPKKKNSKLDESDENRKRKLRKKRKSVKLKDKDTKKKKKITSTTKKDAKKKRKKKSSLDSKPVKPETHPDYQDDIQFFADRLDAERQLKGKTKHKTKINISLEEFDLDEASPASQKKEEVKVDLLKMNEEYLKEQKRKTSKERSCSKEKSKKHETRKKISSENVVQKIKKEPNSWESEEEILVDNQLIKTPDPKPLDLEMPLNIKTYCRRDIEKDNADLQFDIPTTPKKGRWDIKSSKPEEPIDNVLEDEYEEFMKAVTDTIIEEIKPVPAPNKTIQKPLINLSLSANVTQNITLSLATSVPSVSAPITSSVQISTPNLVSLTIPSANKEAGGDVMSFSIPATTLNCDDVKNLASVNKDLVISAVNEDVKNVSIATVEDVKELHQDVKELKQDVKELSVSSVDVAKDSSVSQSSVVTNSEEIRNFSIVDKDLMTVSCENVAPLPVASVATTTKEIMNFSIPTKNIPVINEEIMNLSIPAVPDKEMMNFACDTINRGNYMSFQETTKDIMNYQTPTKSIPVINTNIMNYSMPSVNNYTDKDAFNIPLNKDIDDMEAECDWKPTFKPIMLPTKSLVGSTKLNLEDFDGHLEESFESFIEESDIKDTKRKDKEISPSKRDKKTRKDSASSRSRKDSPVRKRKDSPPPRRKDSLSPRRKNSPSPRRKKSPLKRHTSPKSRRTSPKRRLSPRRRRTPSPRKKSKYSPSRDRKRSPRPRRTSPAKHLPDSTISDDQLPQIDNFLAKQKPHEDSPQRLPLDIRINQVLGLDTTPKGLDSTPKGLDTTPKSLNTTPKVLDSTAKAPSEQFYHQQHYNNVAKVPARPVQQSTYKQVGNMLQIVPTEEEPPMMMSNPEPPPRQDAYARFQHHHPFASTPTLTQPRSQIRQMGNMLEIVPTEMVPMDLQTQFQIKTEKVDEDYWQQASTKVEADAKLSAEAAMLQKEAERLTERENRRIEREKRKQEKERRRQEREKLRQIKHKEKTEKMIKKALELEIDQILKEDEGQWSPGPSVNNFSDFKGKSILVNKLSSADVDKSNKTVQFADGIRPGEGTSPSAGEELFSPPPPQPLPKEKRFKKTLFGKKKGKKKAKAIKRPSPVESDSEDSQPPPSPPPGSPPPHIFPPRVKVKPVNNVPAALLASIIQTAQQQQYQQQYRPPTINMMMAPPPPPVQGPHPHSQSPSLPPMSPQFNPALAAPPQPGHSRHF